MLNNITNNFLQLQCKHYMYGEIPGDERANKKTDPVLSNSIYHEE